ncbi:hypothetical protein U9M48_033183, partial [Paspalum notatum var. saurae]
IITEAERTVNYRACMHSSTTHHRRVKNASSINMKLEAMALGDFADLVNEQEDRNTGICILCKCNSLPMCVLQADEPCGRVMQIRVPDSSHDLVDVHGAVGVVGHGLCMHAADGGDAAVLVDVDVRVVAEDGLAAADVAVHEDGDEVAHGTRRHEQRGLLARDRGHLRLEALRGGVGAQDVVVDGGGGHGGPHGLGGLGHRVRPEVHHRLARHLVMCSNCNSAAS